MKRLLVSLLTVMVFVSMLSAMASAALLGSWKPSIGSVITTTPGSSSFSSIIEAVAKFEGTLQAYSVRGDPHVEEQVLLASDDISDSLKFLNAELTAVYPNLSKEQQQAVEDVYLSLGSYLVTLAEEANQVFQDEGRSTATFEVQNVGEIAPNLPNQLWVGSAISV